MFPFAFICSFCLVCTSSHSFSSVCVHACVCMCVCGVITSCLLWLEMVSLIPLHHMLGFICILCQELMEFCTARSESLWRHQTWCDVCIQPPALLFSDWFVVFLLCSVVVSFLFCHISPVWMNFAWKSTSFLFLRPFQKLHYTSLHPSRTKALFVLIFLVPIHVKEKLFILFLQACCWINSCFVSESHSIFVVDF